MLSSFVPILDSFAGCLIAGFFNGVLDHPYATVLLLAMLAVAVSLLFLGPAERGSSEWLDGE